MPRHDGRRQDELRPCTIERGYNQLVAGSALISIGRTRVLCTASLDQGIPAWRAGRGLGWVTAEYDMLPAAGGQRKPRNRQQVDGRTQEIQRLIGRTLRSVVDMSRLGENTIILDCDVLQADGGTRTAAITGAYVALTDAVRAGRAQGWIQRDPIREPVAAVSVGIVDGRVVLDLDYAEDSTAQVDFNVAMTRSGRLIEVQGTAEGTGFRRNEMNRMIDLAARGIRRLIRAQTAALGQPLPAGSRKK